VRVTAERRERQRVGLLRHRTRSRGRFSMAVTLPGHVDSVEVTPSLDHGLLTIVVPKTERARRRRIPVGRP
jgi:HSP20 family protein